MKILISGGHLTPALAFIEYALTQKQHEIVYVGRKYSMSGKQQLSIEKDEVTQRDVTFEPLDSGKLGHRGGIWLVYQVVLFFRSLWESNGIFQKHKPDVFLSFGGYLAVPLAVVAWLHRIPVVTHEQTRAAGVANKFVAKLAKKVAVSYPETVTEFPVQKTVVTGNPFRQALLNKKVSQPKWFTSSSKKPILYVTGGNQGSQTINLLVRQVLPQLTQDWVVIHQCGRATKQMNYLAELELAQKQLPPDQKDRYFVREWVTQEELAWIYRHVTLIISRAGANTVQEITLAAKPALFIPLALAHGSEQLKNAQAVASTGAAEILLQKEANEQTLLQTIQKCVRHYRDMLAHAKLNREAVRTDADKLLYELVVSTAQS